MITNGSPPSRKELEEAFRRNLVLDCAEELFAKHGFDRTTVAEIAQSSDLAKGSLYQLFESKEEIIEAIISRKLDEAVKSMTEILNSDMAPIKKIRAFIRAKLGEIWKSRDFAKIFLHELRGFHWCPDPRLFEQNFKKMKNMMQRFTEVFAEGQRKGEFRSDISPSALFAALAGLSNGVLFFWLENPDELDLDKAINETETLFFKGVEVEK